MASAPFAMETESHKGAGRKAGKASDAHTRALGSCCSARVHVGNLLIQFAYRKVEVSGRFDHSREVLLGPRTREGVLGYSVITPFVRVDGDPASAILVNRGHVSLTRMKQADRPESLINESQEIVGMLRSQEKRNMFSPANRPEIGEYQFMDIEQMASAMGTQPVLVDQIFEGNAGQMKSMISHGVPLGRAPTIELRNMHATYAITWYSLSFATTIMLWRLMRKPIKHNRFIRHQ
ncbi:surf-like protein [Cystobasidiomycetes sp. EMM_F5]